ncbi:MAG TPA: GDSL-type esterase/lipase family protein [Gallionellaceae bacterium]
MPGRLAGTGASLVLLLAAWPCMAVAALQVEVHPGPFPGELSCPALNRPSPKSKGHRDDVLVPPGHDELAGLPIRAEAYSQDIYLGERRRADPSRPFSIGLWGDSHAASNYFSEELMRALGLTQDEVQPTFIPPTMDRAGVHLPIRKYCQSPGWSYEYAYTSSQAGADFAKGLVNLRSSERNSYLWVDFRAQAQVPALRSVDMLYVSPARGEMILVGISADDGAEKFVELNAEGNGRLRIRAERPVSTIKLRLILGTLALQGFVPQYLNRPALYLDTLGIPGATVRGWKALNADYLKQSDSSAAYDLVILEYGTNEGNDQNLDLEKYVADLRASLKNLRQVYPDSLCVLIGPTDRGVLVKRPGRNEYQPASAFSKDLLHYAQVHHRLGTIQAAIGKEYSCAFWSWQDAMGGPGGVYSWLHHTPPLMARDLTHLTVSGYQLSARKFVADTRLTNYTRVR